MDGQWLISFSPFFPGFPFLSSLTWLYSDYYYDYHNPCSTCLLLEQIWKKGEKENFEYQKAAISCNFFILPAWYILPCIDGRLAAPEHRGMKKHDDECQRHAVTVLVSHDGWVLSSIFLVFPSGILGFLHHLQVEQMGVYPFSSFIIFDSLLRLHSSVQEVYSQLRNVLHPVRERAKDEKLQDQCTVRTIRNVDMAT